MKIKSQKITLINIAKPLLFIIIKCIGGSLCYNARVAKITVIIWGMEVTELNLFGFCRGNELYEWAYYINNGG